MKFVVTGSIGCGKSAVVKMLREVLPDYRVVDFDAIVHNLYEDSEMQMALLLAFGCSERKRVSDIVHASQEAMNKLGSIMNKQIMKRLHDECQTDNLILDVPLWFEHIEPWISTFKIDINGVVCVTCSPERQRERIRSRNGFDDEKINSIIAKQLPQDEKARRSNVVIDNSGTVDDLRKQVVAFVQRGFP